MNTHERTQLVHWIFMRYTFFEMVNRRRSKHITDQGMKLEAVAMARGWTKNIHWEIELGVKPSTLANWRAGRPISVENLDKVARAVGLTPADFNLSLPEFCARVGVENPEAALDDISRKFASGNEFPYFHHQNMSAQDANLLDAISGRYTGMFLCRSGEMLDKEYIRPEIFEIYPRTAGGSCVFEHRNNSTVTGPLFGRISVTSERVYGYVSSYEAHYPASQYLMIPFRLKNMEKFMLYGVYLDVSPIPHKGLFAVPFLMLPDVLELGELPEIIGADDFRFAPLHKVLDDRSVESARGRLVILSSFQMVERMHALWREITTHA